MAQSNAPTHCRCANGVAIIVAEGHGTDISTLREYCGKIYVRALTSSLLSKESIALALGSP